MKSRKNSFSLFLQFFNIYMYIFLLLKTKDVLIMNKKYMRRMGVPSHKLQKN